MNNDASIFTTISRIFGSSMVDVFRTPGFLFLELRDGSAITFENLTKLAFVIGTQNIHMESGQVDVENEWDEKTWDAALPARLVCQL